MRVAQVRSSRLLRQFNDLGFPTSDGSERCVVGHPKPPTEIDQFLEFAKPMKLSAVITITPSEVVSGTISTPCFGRRYFG